MSFDSRMIHEAGVCRTQSDRILLTILKKNGYTDDYVMDPETARHLFGQLGGVTKGLPKP